MRHLAEKAKVVKMRKNPEIGEIRARMPRRARYAPAANAVLGHYGGGGGRQEGEEDKGWFVREMRL
jgi:hypothetical protein